MNPVIVGITGASGVVYGVKTLIVLRELNVPAHLILTEAGALNLKIETEYSEEYVRNLAERVYDNGDLAAGVASGSFLTGGMIIAPCSIKSLSAIVNSFNYNLLIRAADVTIKEKRPLVLMVRETPLHQGHLDLMKRAAELGACILPPVPAFYHKPQTIDDIIGQSVGKALDILGVEHRLFRRWGA